MSEEAQRKALQNQIWSIANEVRGAVDGWDFKQYVLGTLFYRFISENFTDYIEAGDDSIDYASMGDDEIDDEQKRVIIEEKGYFIYPSQLFKNVVKNASNNAPIWIKFLKVSRAQPLGLSQSKISKDFLLTLIRQATGLAIASQIKTEGFLLF